MSWRSRLPQLRSEASMKPCRSAGPFSSVVWNLPNQKPREGRRLSCQHVPLGMGFPFLFFFFLNCFLRLPLAIRKRSLMELPLPVLGGPVFTQLDAGSSVCVRLVSKTNKKTGWCLSSTLVGTELRPTRRRLRPHLLSIPSPPPLAHSLAYGVIGPISWLRVCAVYVGPVC